MRISTRWDKTYPCLPVLSRKWPCGAGGALAVKHCGEAAGAAVVLWSVLARAGVANPLIAVTAAIVPAPTSSAVVAVIHASKDEGARAGCSARLCDRDR